MKLVQTHSKIFIPGSLDAEKSLARTTHLAIGAHQDDLEIMAVDGILECFQRYDKWFTGVVVTDGRGSPRSGVYADYTDEEMMAIRIIEQENAARIGDYSAQIFLDYPSSAVKDRSDQDPVHDLENIIRATSPQVVYTHNLADKHPTHIGVAVKTIQAIRNLSSGERPKKIYGCEVWRALDWMMDEEKIAFDCSVKENMQLALLGVFDSQVSGGKRYDLATMGRRVANATYFASHGTDETTGQVFAMDLTPLIENPDLDIVEFVQGFISRFGQDVKTLISSVL